MSYTSGGLIQASDYTGLATTINNTLSSHYGQTGLSGQSTGNIVTAAHWNTLSDKTNGLINHQGLNGRSYATGYVAGTTVTSSTNLSSAINTLNGYRFYAASNSTVLAGTATLGNTWNNYTDHRFTVTGGNLDYFFNSGGQIKLSFYHPFTTPWDGLVSDLASQCGTIVISATSGAIIAGTTYDGVAKVGGSGTPSTLNSGLGWYGLTGSWQMLVQQYASNLPSGAAAAYASTNIYVNAYKSGNDLYLQIVYDEAPNGVTMSAGTSTNLYIASPSTTHISNSWGTVSATGSVAGWA